MGTLPLGSSMLRLASSQIPLRASASLWFGLLIMGHPRCISVCL